MRRPTRTLTDAHGWSCVRRGRHHLTSRRKAKRYSKHSAACAHVDCLARAECPKPWTPSPAGIMSRSLFARIANARSLAAIAMKPMLTKGRAWRLGRTRLWIGPKRKNESPRASDAKLRHRLLAMVRVQHRASSIRLKNPRMTQRVLQRLSTESLPGLTRQSMMNRNSEISTVCAWRISSWMRGSSPRMTLSVWYHLSVRHGRAWSGHPCL